MKRPALTPEQRGNIYLASGSTHPALAKAIAASIGVPLHGVERRGFANTERYVRYEDNMRKKQVFIIQSLAAVRGLSVNDSFVEALLMVDAAKRASAAEITIVAPHLAYQRQDKKRRPREPLSAAAILTAFHGAGAKCITAMDIHSPATVGSFDGPFDPIPAAPLLLKALKEHMATNPGSYIMVSPDGGGAPTTEKYADKLGLSIAYAHKSRDPDDSSKITRPKYIEGVDGRHCVMVDDMVDTGGTHTSAAGVLMDSGAVDVTLAATHLLFSDKALETLQESPISKIIGTDTVPVEDAIEALGSRLDVVSCAELIGSAVCEMAFGGSLAELFGDHGYR